MADANFDGWQATELVYEGGLSNDKNDRGGRTFDGITQTEWDAWCKLKGLPKSDVATAPADQISAIYREQYWLVSGCDWMPSGMDYFVGDGSVNSGPGQSIKWLQASLAAFKLYAGNIDGVPGTMTKRGALAAPDVDLIIADMAERRTAFLRAIVAHDSTQGEFLDGWLARVANITKKGEALATGSIGPDPIELPQSPKASPVSISNSAPPVSTEVAVGTAGAAAAASAANEALSKATDGIQAAGQLSGVLRYALLAVVVVGVLFALYAVMRGNQKAAALSATAKAPLPREADEPFVPAPEAPASVTPLPGKPIPAELAPVAIPVTAIPVIDLTAPTAPPPGAVKIS